MKHLRRILRFIFFLNFVLLVAIGAMWATWHVLEGGPRISPKLSDVVIELATLPSKAYHYIFDGGQMAAWHINDDTTTTQVYREAKGIAQVKILISTYEDESNLKVSLTSIGTNKIFKTWRVNIPELSDKLKFLKIPATAWAPAIQHPFMLKDSSIVFIADGLFKVDKNNKLELLNADIKYHHTIEDENDSIFWICASKRVAIEPSPRDTTLVEDVIAGYNIKTNRVFHIKSIRDALTESGYGAMFRGPGVSPNDRFHINDIQPVKVKSKFWEIGDLFVSVRHLSTIFLYRPSTQKIIWLKQGPWLSQHDVDVVDEKMISVFNNDVLRAGEGDKSVQGYNKVLYYDFKSDSISSPYTSIFKKLKINTIAEGRCDLLPNGDLYVDEANNAKLYILNKDSLKWRYIERVDKRLIKRFNWPRLISN